MAGPVTWFGEIALFDGQPRTHDAIALDDALLLHVPQAALLAILDATPQYWRQFALLMAQKLRLSFLTVESMSVMPAAQRLAARLLMIADGYGGISAGRTRIRLSQEKLAAMLSLTRQTTNQLLKALQADGVVRLHVGEIGSSTSMRCGARAGCPTACAEVPHQHHAASPPSPRCAIVAARPFIRPLRLEHVDRLRSVPPSVACVHRVPAARPHVVRRPGRASRLLPHRVRHAARLAHRAHVCGSRRAMPVPARPASSQVGMAIGLARAGYAGMFAAWLGFTLPSALLMMLFALGVHATGAPIEAGALHGLRIVSVAVIAQAVWGWRARCARMRAASR